MTSFFIELSIVMLITLIFSIIMTKLKQPLLIGYILTGVISGPLFFNILSSSEGYETFSHLGVALLLFIVGLHLNLKLIKEIGFISMIAGVFQIFITSLFAFIISFIFGFDIISSILISIGISFSSTIVIVKLLTDKKDIEKVHGKLTIGVLIVQDLVAILSLMVISSIINVGINENLTFEILKTFSFGIITLGLVMIFSKLILEKLLDFIAQSQDMLFIFIISWVLGVSALFTYLGFSIEVGALLAGIALASSPYQFEISSKVKPLRDFFIVMFFILLGSQMIPVNDTLNHQDIFQDNSNLFNSIHILINNINNSFSYLITNFSSIFLPALILIIFVIVIKPIIIFIIFNLLGFHKRVSFQTGISLGQISEFSLILILLAQTSNLIDSKIISLITLIAITSITVSTYLIMHYENLYIKFRKLLNYIEIRKSPKRDAEKIINKKYDVLIFGYDRIGFSLLNSIKKLGKKYVVIDYNPKIIKKLEDNQIDCIYADANELDLMEEFNLNNIELMISTIPNLETNLNLIKEFKEHNNGGIIILTANQIDDALELYHQGADYVILPHFLGGNYISSLIENYEGNLQGILVEKLKHINELKIRKNHGHEHPN